MGPNKFLRLVPLPPASVLVRSTDPIEQKEAAVAGVVLDAPPSPLRRELILTRACVVKADLVREMLGELAAASREPTSPMRSQKMKDVAAVLECAVEAYDAARARLAEGVDHVVSPGE